MIDQSRFHCNQHYFADQCGRNRSDMLATFRQLRMIIGRRRRHLQFNQRLPGWLFFTHKRPLWSTDLDDTINHHAKEEDPCDTLLADTNGAWTLIPIAFSFNAMGRTIRGSLLFVVRNEVNGSNNSRKFYNKQLNFARTSGPTGSTVVPDMTQLATSGRTQQR